MSHWFAFTVMIFVNYGGGGYWFFQHAPWNGKAHTDATILLLRGVAQTLQSEMTNVESLPY